MSLAIVPGSFDPMTLGHLDVIRVAAERYDEVVVAVMINREKTYHFSEEMRIRIAEATVASLPNVRVIFDDGMLIDLFDRLGADVVCKGWRNEADLRYEEQMARWNRDHNPRFRTELIRAEEGHTSLSSTAVRQRLGDALGIAGMVHPDALSLILQASGKANENDFKFGGNDI